MLASIFTNIYFLFLLGLALLLGLFFFVRKRKRLARCRLHKDPFGYWRYHDETQFEVKEPWGKQIEPDTHTSEPSTHPLAVAVIDFVGDLKARQRQNLSRAVDELLINKEHFSEVVVRIDSPGGAVPHYGHAFAEMERLRESGLRLVVCIDVVAASGGYLMSLPAHHIVAAPFAFVGSVGVMAFVPNFRGLLADFKVNPRTFTAGKYKRTVTLTDEATPEEIAVFQSQLEAIHRMFVGALQKYRPQSNIDMVATGEHWTADESRRLNLELVDEVGTSATYLLKKNEYFRLVSIKSKKKFLEDGLLATIIGENARDFGYLKSIIEKLNYKSSGNIIQIPIAQINNKAEL